MNKFELIYDHDRDMGENFLIGLDNSKYQTSFCTCGFESTGDYLECPNCKSKKMTTLNFGYNNISGQRSCTYIDKAKFTNEGAFILIKEFEISAKYSVKSKGTKLNFKLEKHSFKKKEYEATIEFYYYTNKNGKKALKKRLVVNGEEKNFIKNNIMNLSISYVNDNVIRNMMNKLTMETCYYINDAIWSIHNRYKYAPVLMEAGIIDIYGSKDMLIKASHVYNDETLRPYFLELIEIEKEINGNYTRMSTIMDYFADECEDYTTVEYAKKSIELLKTPSFEIDNKYWMHQLIKMHLIQNYTKEDMENFYSAMDRQAYTFGYDAVYKIVRMAKLFKEYNIPFDKVPKEMHIYFNKLAKLNDLINNSIFNVSIIEEMLNKELIVFRNEKIIDIAYHLRENFSVLDKMLVDHYMNNLIPFYIKDNKDAILIFNNKDRKIEKIYLKDTVLDNKKDIDEYIDNLKGALVLC